MPEVQSPAPFIVVAPPPPPFTGAGVVIDLHAAGFVDAKVTMNGGMFEVTGVALSDADKVQAIVSSHVHTEPPTPVDPDEGLRLQIAAATTVTELKAALLGSTPGSVRSVAGRAMGGT